MAGLDRYTKSLLHFKNIVDIKDNNADNKWNIHGYPIATREKAMYNSFLYFNKNNNSINDYLELTNRTLSIGERDTTIEFCLYIDKIQNSRVMEFHSKLTDILISISEDKLKLTIIPNDKNKKDYRTTELISDSILNRAVHIAYCYDYELSRINLYINGKYQDKITYQIPKDEFTCIIGKSNIESIMNFKGSIGEIRISNVKRWYTNFDVVETVMDENTEVLLKFSNTQLDEIKDNYWQTYGYPVISSNSNLKFGKGLYFDGDSYITTDSLYIGKRDDNTDTIKDIDVIKDFTIDFWGYLEKSIPENFNNSNGNNTNSKEIIFNWNDIELDYIPDTGKLKLYTGKQDINDSDEDSEIVFSGIYIETLFHFAIVYHHSRKILKVYINGRNEYSTVYEIEEDVINRPVRIGLYMKGYIEEFRVSDGIARYVSDFEVTKHPYSRDTYIKGTRVLLDFNDMALRDKRGNTWLYSEKSYLTTEGAKYDKAIQFNQSHQCVYSKYPIRLGGTDLTIEMNLYIDKSKGTILYIRNEDSTFIFKIELISRGNQNNEDEIENKCRIFYHNRDIDREYEFSVRVLSLIHLTMTYNYETREFSIYQNGKLLKLVRLRYQIEEDDYYIYIGNEIIDNTDIENSLSTQFYGKISEFRVSDILRWKKEFAIPKDIYNLDSHTKILLHGNLSVLQDMAGNIWSVISNGTKYTLIEDNKLKLNSVREQYLELKEGIYLGGQDFTIAITAKIDEDSTVDAKLLTITNDLEDKDKSYIAISRSGTHDEIDCRIGFKGNYTGINIEGLVGEEHKYIILYKHEEQEILFIIDDEIRGKEKLESVIDRQKFKYCWIGKSNYQRDGWLSGYIKSIAIVDGIAIEDKDITTDDISTEYLKNIDKDTKILLHFDESTVRDEVGNQWISNGTRRGVELSTYIDKLGKSCYFDGKTYLKLNNSIEIGDRDFVIDFWLYIEKLSEGDSTRIFEFSGEDITSYSKSIHCFVSHIRNELRVVIDRPSNYLKAPILINHLNHIAIYYDYENKTVKLFLNRIEVDAIYCDIPRRVFRNIVLGHSGEENSLSSWYKTFLTGYIDEFRVEENKSFVIEDKNSFSISRLPYIETGYTKSILRFEDNNLVEPLKYYNHGLYYNHTWTYNGLGVMLFFDKGMPDDYYANNNWIVNGNPTTEQMYHKYNGKSYYNNGNIDNYLVCDNFKTEKFMNTDFTIDFWVYLADLSNQGFISSDMSESYWEGLVIACIDKQLRFSARYGDSWHDNNIFQLSSNEWIHIALVRRDNLIYGFKNGKLQKTVELDSDIQGIHEDKLYIGYWYRHGGAVNGFIDELRMINEAIWTSNFETRAHVKDYFVKNTVAPFDTYGTFLYKHCYIKRDYRVEFGGNDFTIESYINTEQNNIIYQFVSDSNSNKIVLRTIKNIEDMENTNETDNSITNKFVLDINDDSYSIKGLDINETYLLSIIYDYAENKLYIYKQGKIVDIIELINKIERDSYEVYIGNSANQNKINFIDEFRILDGVKAYRQNYKIQLSDYEVTDDTIALLHFEESVTKDEVEDNQWSIKLGGIYLPEIKYTDKTRYGNSIYFNGDHQWIELIDGLYIGGEDFTIDFWYFNYMNLQNKGKVFSAYSQNHRFEIGVNENQKGYPSVTVDEDKYILEINTKNSLYHFALVYEYEDRTLTLYLNGKEGLKIREVIIEEQYYPNVYIGKSINENQENQEDYAMINIDEFRYSKVARWSEDFYPANEPYSRLEYIKKLRVKKNDVVYKLPLYYDEFEDSIEIKDKENSSTVYIDKTDLEWYLRTS